MASKASDQSRKSSSPLQFEELEKQQTLKNITKQFRKRMSIDPVKAGAIKMSNINIDSPSMNKSMLTQLNLDLVNHDKTEHEIKMGSHSPKKQDLRTPMASSDMIIPLNSDPRDSGLSPFTQTIIEENEVGGRETPATFRKQHSEVPKI